jgi:hypothetical protein
MSNLVCNYTIPGGGRGGRLVGDGFGRGNPPTLGATQTLQVVITWGGAPNTAPQTLTGYSIFSSAAPPTSNQAAPTPFMNASNYLCYVTQTASASSGPGNTVQFTFPALQYAGNNAGQYELTFIAQVGTGAAATQWSADPEFDTSS